MHNSIEITPRTHVHAAELASVVAKAMLHNPLHIAVFKSANERSERMQVKMFTKVLQLRNCNLFAAQHNGKLAGVMNYYEAGCCQLNTWKTLSLLPGLSFALGNKLPRVLKWKANWGKHDPKFRHLHFGPLAVLPSMQGQGIGSALLHNFCQLADKRQMDAYLETDKEANLRLYERCGFKIVEEDELYGVKNWFMWREYLSIK